MVAVQSGTLLRALSVQLKRRVSTHRVGDYNEVPQAIQKKSRLSPQAQKKKAKQLRLGEDQVQ